MANVDEMIRASECNTYGNDVVVADGAVDGDAVVDAMIPRKKTKFKKELSKNPTKSMQNQYHKPVDDDAVDDDRLAGLAVPCHRPKRFVFVPNSVHFHSPNCYLEPNSVRLAV